MSISSPKRLVASMLVVSLSSFAVPVFAAPTTATLTGTVLGDDVRTPLAGVTVLVTDAAGHSLSSAPTGADGAFTVDNVGAGATRLALSTPDGSFPIATPVVLAPGQTRGVRVALKAKQDKADDDDDKSAAAPPTDGGKGMGAMIGVLVGFVAASAVAISASGDDDDNPAASPSNPND